MSLKPIDFHGIVSLDTPLVDLIDQYLEERESELAYAILEALPNQSSEPMVPFPPFAERPLLKMSEAIEIFGRRTYQNGPGGNPEITYAEWRTAVKKINNALWSYLETIEGCITELFQQLDLISLDQWHARLAQVMGSVKDILIHRMEDLIWAVKRLENLLWKCRFACENSNSRSLVWLNFLSIWKHLLDRSIFSNLEKNQEWLKNQYAKFMKRYHAYLSLLSQVDKSLDKFSNYPVLPSLERELQKKFVELYQLLKLWELNNEMKALPSRDFVLALRNAMSIDKALTLFNEYSKAHRLNIFDLSLSFKKNPEELVENESQGKTRWVEFIASCQAETHTLGATIAHYREFLLKSDPNPYVRTKIGFSEPTIDAEPSQTKPLLNLGYDVEGLNELYEQLDKALKRGSTKIDYEEIELRIAKSLHEMIQPLATHRMLRHSAEEVLDNLQQMDELGSFDKGVIPFFGEILSKLLRADWRYHVLHGIPLFHQLYATHIGLVKPIEDRAHQNRLKKFHKLLNQIQEWVKLQKTQAHHHDIELDINDIKGYLQDFFASVQRLSSDPNLPKDHLLNTYDEIAQELLEYRYLFGNFFYQLRQNETDGLFIRRQFLFVDQYFESIEQKLNDLLQTAESN